MNNGLFLVMLTHMFSFMTHTSSKVLLIKTAVEHLNERKAGEDYNDPITQYRCPVPEVACPECGILICPDGCNIEEKTVLWYRVTDHSCVKTTTPPTTTTTRTITTTATKDSCLRTPRNIPRNLRFAKKLRRKNQRANKDEKKKKLWGFWVEKGRKSVEGFSFCCTRGPRTGTLARTPRKCRTPRKSQKT